MRVRAAIAAALLISPSALLGQGATPERKPDSTASAPAKAPAFPFDISGVIYTYFQKGGLKGARAQDRFGLDRAYFTLRGSAGERVSFRITTDVYQQQDTLLSSYYRGWAIRAKYAYVQYDYLRGGADRWKANARIGLVHTVVVDHEEQATDHGVWPRGIQQVAVEQAGFFTSSDEGVATTVTLPKKYGELYATIVNGTGYGSRELDRFKDYGMRLTLTPLARTTGFLKGLDISPWISIGDRASDFADRDHGTVHRVDEGQRRDRYGLLLMVKDPRLSIGYHAARRIDVVESADTLRATVPTATERTGTVNSVYALIHPAAFSGSAHPLPLALLLRADDVQPDRNADAYQRFYLAGLTWEINKKTSITFDYQTQEPKAGSHVPDLKTYFVHVIANF